ncbi:methyltransferase domain-containing protein [Haloferula sp.]|uniref:methyltransferase domain-containing protein n=1 Tax=Haloferula sp. TaxID=2497595 RepID=UPI00329BA0AA
MKHPIILLPLLFLLILGLLVWHPWRHGDLPAPPPTLTAEPATAPIGADPSTPEELIQTQEEIYGSKPASPDGIGKVYMDREISHVMGHEGINWLERWTREEEEAPSKAIDVLNLKADAVIADIGAGSGYYTFRIAKLVPEGQVMAVDIQPEMIAYLEAKEEELGLNNVTAHLGSIDDTRLDPESIDAALMVDAYHEFSHPREIMESIFTALRPGGRVILLEYRAEDPNVPIKPLHKMTEAQSIKEMEAVGLKWETTHDHLPWQHLMVFSKP